MTSQAKALDELDSYVVEGLSGSSGLTVRAAAKSQWRRPIPLHGSILTAATFPDSIIIN